MNQRSSQERENEAIPVLLVLHRHDRVRRDATGSVRHLPAVQQRYGVVEGERFEGFRFPNTEPSDQSLLVRQWGAPMKVHMEINEDDLRDLVVAHFRDAIGNEDLSPSNVKIEVKSKQNYKAEWEVAAFRASLDQTV